MLPEVIEGKSQVVESSCTLGIKADGRAEFLGRGIAVSFLGKAYAQVVVLGGLGLR
jgi:hypothetical protein